MPAINWTQASLSPRATLRIIFFAGWQSICEVVARVFQRSGPKTLSLRNIIARAWLGTTFVHNAGILYSEPSTHAAQKVGTEEFSAYLIPSTKPSELQNADAVIIFSHGGGMMMGHPLQYLDSYERWIKKARDKGGKVVFLALKYPLSPSAKWPAQRESLLAAFKWVLAQSVPASRIVFAGDSAGCDLQYLTLLHIRDHQKPLPQPSCVVSLSPWLDWTGAETIGSPNCNNDFMFYYDSICPILNETLRPIGLPPDTAEISSLLANDLSRLPPQLVMYSRDEILASDSTRWIKRSREAGVEMTDFGVNGEMHTFAVGWPICGIKMQNKCDEVMLNYILGHTKIE